MGKKSRDRHRKSRRTKRADPLVHVKVVHAEGDLAGAASLIKPALLYADQVTIYSPAASLVNQVLKLGEVTDPRTRFIMSLDLIDAVPHLRGQLNVDADTFAQLRSILALDPRLLRQVLSMTGDKAAMDGYSQAVDEMSKIWNGPMQEAMEQIIETTAATELLVAVKSGAVDVADMAGGGTRGVIADSVRAAVGDRRSDLTDDMLSEFLARVIEMLTEGSTFPLLDASSAGLVRILERESRLNPSAVASRRSSEIHTAADFMSFLPYFTELPMDEVLDLRDRLANPLARFRSEMVSMAREFQTRSFDQGFAVEVQDAWRQRVEPALADIREGLAEHGFLQEVKSVALGDLKALLVEAGGVIGIAHGNVISLSGLMTATMASGVPAAHMAGSAIKEMQTARREIRKSAFYFLHRVGAAAERLALSS
ncbi:MAG: hypothetical protein ACJ77A_11170 [Actinomycetota bacterium]